MYFLKRLFLIPPTLFVIILINFMIVQTAPGGPVEQFIAKMNHAAQASGEVATANVVNATINANNDQSQQYRGSAGIDAEIIAKIKTLYGFDLPIQERFWMMVKKFAVFDFGVSFYQDKKVIDLILEKLPVSISIGL